jgi:hypothetical protein
MAEFDPKSSLPDWEQEAVAEEEARRQRIREAVDSGRMSPHDAVWRENVRENEELVKTRLENEKAGHVEQAQPSPDLEPKEEQAPEQKTERRELPFFEQRDRNYDDLKLEHADAKPMDAEQEKGKEQVQGKALTFHEDHNHDPGHTH